MRGVALALLSAAFTRVEAIVGVVPVNVDVGSRVAFPDGLAVVLGVVRRVEGRLGVGEDLSVGAGEIVPELEPLGIAVELLFVAEGLLGVEGVTTGGRVAVLLGWGRVTEMKVEGVGIVELRLVAVEFRELEERIVEFLEGKEPDWQTA
ncbi:hypothetical protein GP486_007647 [Trichoglossum hirsutum]|uniref:Uncharacterized protein n=1 Tax=Trichoglossum hirsutum TaxID=265104 RepID=A0A9P8IBG0_9PEZI|nr:hypothetical protein GP486_007647 [Trichoglossum hirsutum]